jgi:hypothetical protein
MPEMCLAALAVGFRIRVLFDAQHAGVPPHVLADGTKKLVIRIEVKAAMHGQICVAGDIGAHYTLADTAVRREVVREMGRDQGFVFVIVPQAIFPAGKHAPQAPAELVFLPGQRRLRRLVDDGRDHDLFHSISHPFERASSQTRSGSTIRGMAAKWLRHHDWRRRKALR